MCHLPPGGKGSGMKIYMGEVITNLKARFSAESKDVPRGLKPAEDAFTSLDKSVNKNILGLKNLMPQFTAIGLAAGVFKVLKESIQSVEGPADKLDGIMGGLKEATFEFGEAIATTDTENFIKDITEGFKAGKEFAEMLDDLADKSAYNDYRISQLRRESAALQEIVKDKTKELSVRADAAEKVKAIEEQIQKRREDLAKEEFNIAKAQWKERNDMETSEAMRLYEIIDSYSQDARDKLATAYEQTKKDFKGKITDDVFITHMMQLTDYTRAANENYLKYIRMVTGGESEVLVKLFKAYKNVNEETAQAQEDYNSSVAQTTKLLAQEEKQADKTAKSLRGITDNLKESVLNAEAGAAGIVPVDTSNISIPDLNPQIKDLQDFSKVVTDTNDKVKVSMDDMNKAIEASVVNAIEGFGTWLGEFAAGTASTEDLVNLVGTLLGDMLIRLGEVAVAAGGGLLAIDEAFKNMNPYVALAAGAALIGLGAAVKGAVSSISSDVKSGSVGSANYIHDMGSISSAWGTKSSLNISGQISLRASGSDLVAVLDSENLRLAMNT